MPESGMAAADAISKCGLYGGIAVVVMIVLAFIGYKVFGSDSACTSADAVSLGLTAATAGGADGRGGFSAVIYPGQSQGPLRARL
jgi:hypothetical protein